MCRLALVCRTGGVVGATSSESVGEGAAPRASGGGRYREVCSVEWRICLLVGIAQAIRIHSKLNNTDSQGACLVL